MIEIAQNVLEFYSSTNSKFGTMKNFLENWGSELSMYTEDWEKVNTPDLLQLMQDTVDNEFSGQDWDDINTWNDLCDTFADNFLNYIQVSQIIYTYIQEFFPVPFPR